MGQKQDDFQALVPGTLLNHRYQVKSLLGRGGMGFVYSAYDQKTDTDIAIKELFPSACCQRIPGQKSAVLYSKNAVLQYQDYKNYFIQEAKIMAKLNGCPNLVSLKDLFEENDTCYYTMELLKGKTLSQLLRSQQLLLLETDAVYIAKGVLNALTCLHQNGIIHRDICCQNIFITDTGVVKVIDFGASALISEQKSLSIILRPSYAPPEQYQSKGILGPWVDVYALGAVLYQIVTGRKVTESVDRVRKDDLVPPNQINNKLSGNFSSIIMKALELEPRKRFQTAEEFRKSLEFGNVRESVSDQACISSKIKKYVFAIAGLVLLIAGCIVTLFAING